VPSKHLISLTEHGGEQPVLQYSPMCSVWALTTYDACDIRCSYCASYAQGPSKPLATAGEVRVILERQLPAVPRKHTICLGAIIDCYAHAEAEHEVTRAALEVLVADGRDLVIVTKGTLIERDLDLLRGYEKVHVNVSVPSLDETVLDDIEPQADTGAERFATIERLADAGVDVQLHVQPWIPGMTDAKRMVEAAAGRFKVWIAPLNIQNPVIARSRWGKRFTQREINEAYVAEMKRVGPHPNVTWARPLWLGDDLLTLSQWGVEQADCALEQHAGTASTPSADRQDDPMRRPTLPIRSSDTPDRAVIEVRDVATTGQIIEALTSGQMASLAMAKLSAHLRVYDARYPERRVATEGSGQLTDLITLVAAMCDADLQVMKLRADWPVVNAGYIITGELIEPFRGFEPGQRVSAEVVATYRYDTYGLLIEQWIQVVLHRAEGASRGVVGLGVAERLQSVVGPSA
jgi:DNA repair photolyase